MGMKVTNLTLHDSGKAIQDSGTVNSLVIDDYKNGFRVEKYNSLDAGLGLSGHWWYDNASGLQKIFFAYVGLIPVKGTKTFSSQYVLTKAQIRKVPLMSKPPMKAQDLKSWTVGDSLTYMTSGGLISFTGAGFGPIASGITSIAKGTWSVFVQKTDESTAYVKITKGNLKSFAIDSNAGLVSLGTSQFNNADKGFSFLINIASDKGQKAYEDLVRGNVAGVQDLVKNNIAVRTVETSSVREKGKFINLFVGIPILLNSTFSAGTIQNVTNSDVKIDDSKISVDYGIYTRDSRTRVFNTHTYKTSVFYGADYTISNEKGTGRSIFGKYSIDLADEDASSNDVRRFISEMVSKTGLNQVVTNVPKTGDLDYAGAHIDFTISQDQTLTMIKAATHMSKTAFVSSQMKSVRAYVNSSRDPWNLCVQSQGFKDDCADKLMKNSERIFGDMHDALIKMKANLWKNPATFTRAYAELGQAIAENAFALQSAIKLAGEGVEVYYRIDGARVSLFEIYMQTGSAGQINTITQPGELPPSYIPNTGADRQRGLIFTPNLPIYPPVNP